MKIVDTATGEVLELQEVIGGDLWEHQPADARVITTNGVVRHGLAVMGVGTAAQAKFRWEGIDWRLGKYIQKWGNRPFVLVRAEVRFGPPFDLISLPVKHNYWQQADIALIHDSLVELRAMANKHGYQHVVLPRPGCGAGGLDWTDVAPVVAKVIGGDPRFTIVDHRQSEVSAVLTA